MAHLSDHGPLSGRLVKLTIGLDSIGSSCYCALCATSATENAVRHVNDHICFFRSTGVSPSCIYKNGPNPPLENAC
jgi:hypothetical protein